MKQSIIKILAGALTLAAFIVLGRTSYVDHKALAELHAKYDTASVITLDDRHGHKLGALVPQRAGDFFVSPVAASPYSLNGSLKLSVTPWNLQDGSGVTRANLSTAHGSFTAGGGGADTSITIGPFSGAETTDSGIFFHPNNGTTPVSIYSDMTNLLLSTSGGIGWEFTSGGALYATTASAVVGTLNNAAFTLTLSGGNAVAGIIVGNGTIDLHSVATTTTAPGAGGAGALPATPAGYATISIGGVAHKIPYY